MSEQTPQHAAPRARRWWLGAAGAAALAAGAGLAWRRHAPAALSAESQALWALQSQQPDGAALPMAGFRGRPLLVNFWAPWCAPCVEELPLIDGFFREQAANGWQVVGLAVDRLQAVQAFLGRTPVSFPIGILGLGGLSVLQQMGNSSGGLPFTLVMDRAGEVAERKMGQISAGDLQRWVAQTSLS